MLGRVSKIRAVIVDGFLSLGDPYVTGEYDEDFAAAWQRVATHQRDQIAQSGWWTRPITGSASHAVIKAALAFGFVIVFSLAASIMGLIAAIGRTWVGTFSIAAIVPALITFLVYRTLLPARTARGSALALRTESFRRFLEASESRHVEWAWSHELIREYSGWAVALGEADAWNRGLQRADVPEPARLGASPILIASMGSSMRSARTAPSNSGGGSGGFGGGGVGGGGGGGSRGFW